MPILNQKLFLAKNTVVILHNLKNVIFSIHNICKNLSCQKLHTSNASFNNNYLLTPYTSGYAMIVTIGCDE